MDYMTRTASADSELSTPELTSISRNLTCEEQLSDVFSSSPPKKWLLALFCIYFILGVFGNGFFVLLFVMKKNLRNIKNAFITNLVFSDFLFIIFFIPLLFFEELRGLRPLGKTFCWISIIINYTSQDVSTMSMTALSYLRYRAVVHPLQLRQDDGKMEWFIPIMCGISWAIGAAAAVFPAIYCEKLSHDCLLLDRHYVNSFENNTHHLTFHIVRFVFFYLLPGLVIASLYSIMAFKLCKTPSTLTSNQSNSTRRVSRSRRKLGGVILAIVVIFFLSWLPTYISWFTGLDDTEFIPWLLTLRKVCMFLPASSNPVILFVTSTDFQKPLLNILSRWCQSGRHILQRLRSSFTTSSTRLSSMHLSRRRGYTQRPPANDFSPVCV